MKFEPKRYTTLMYMITNPVKNSIDLEVCACRGEIYQLRNRELEAILTSHRLGPDSTEEDVKKAIGNCNLSREPESYREVAILELVYDIMPN